MSTARDILLDSGDLDLTNGGSLVADEEAIAQEISVRLHTDQGEYFLDTTRGLPYQRWLAGGWTNSVQTEAKILVRAELLAVPGVASVEPPGVQVTFDPATRTATFSAEVTTDTGELVTITEEI